MVYDTRRWIQKWQQLENRNIFFGGSHTIPNPTFLFSFRITLLKRGQVQSGLWTACLWFRPELAIRVKCRIMPNKRLRFDIDSAGFNRLPRGLRSDSHSYTSQPNPYSHRRSSKVFQTDGQHGPTPFEPSSNNQHFGSTSAPQVVGPEFAAAHAGFFWVSRALCSTQNALILSHLWTVATTLWLRNSVAKPPADCAGQRAAIFKGQPKVAV